MKKIITTLFIILSLTSCVQRITDFTIISTKNISTDSNNHNRVKGQDCTLWIFFIPVFGKMQPNLKDAIDNAIEGDNGYSIINIPSSSSNGKTNGNITGNSLTDGVIYMRFFMLPPLFTYSCYIAEGNLVTK